MDAQQLFGQVQQASATQPSDPANRLRVRFRPGQFMRVKVKGMTDAIRMKVPDDPQVAIDFITGGGLERAMQTKFEEFQNFSQTIYAGLTPEERLAIATMTVPVVGDVTGFAADMGMYIRDPESRTLANGILTGIGAAMSAASVSPAQARALQKVRKNIEAWHGSPHKFDRMSMSQIGTGEGAQAYGHGLYAADEINVAKGYQPRSEAAESVMMERYNQAIGAEDYEAAEIWENAMLHETPDEIVRRYQDPDYPDSMRQKAAQIAEEMKELPAEGGLYKLNINADPDTLLDWDAPLSEQSESVRRALQNIDVPAPRVQDMTREELIDQLQTMDSNGVWTDADNIAEFGAPATREELLESAENLDLQSYLNEKFDLDSSGLTGRSLYTQMEAKFGGGNTLSNEGKARASEALREAGIPGIKYLDGTSRSAGEGTRNYVIFDENLIDVVERNGEPVNNLLGNWDAARDSARYVETDPVKLRNNPELWHPVGDGTKLSRPMSEINPQYEDLANLSESRIITPEDMLGYSGVGFMGDRSDSGRRLIGIGDTVFENPIDLEGGYKFPREFPAAWATNKPAPFVNSIRQAAELSDGNVAGIYLPMGFGSMNFNTMTSDTMLEMMKRGRITKKVKNQFDKELRGFRPEWPGIDSPDARTMLDANGALRHAFMSTANKQTYQKAGFPDLKEVRYATTAPELLDTKMIHGGQSISRLNPGDELVQNPERLHKTYSQQIGGEYMGGFEAPLPYSVLFPDWYKARRAKGAPVSGDFRSLDLGNPVTQRFNQEWLDGVMKYLEEAQQ